MTLFAQRYSLYFGWLFATLGTLGSLYFSEMAHMEPCNLCWYQRAALFPLPIILGIATYRGFLGIARYTIPQVAFGLLFALYQIAIQEIPGWNPVDMCGAGPSCSEKHSIGLGFLSIPMLAAAGFIVILLLLVAAWRAENTRKKFGLMDGRTAS